MILPRTAEESSWGPRARSPSIRLLDSTKVGVTRACGEAPDLPAAVAPATPPTNVDFRPCARPAATSTPANDTSTPTTKRPRASRSSAQGARVARAASVARFVARHRRRGARLGAEGLGSSAHRVRAKRMIRGSPGQVPVTTPRRYNENALEGFPLDVRPGRARFFGAREHTQAVPFQFDQRPGASRSVSLT
jgi:hypothetical protein